jgi:Flp pilus assembly pilin Flp
MIKQTARNIADMVTYLVGLALGILTGATNPTLLPVRARGRRGAGMLEYSMIALISIAVFAALRQFFPTFFEGITKSITERFNSSNG